MEHKTLSVQMGANDMLFWRHDEMHYALRVEHDSDPIDPRSYDNVARLCCGHPRYDLGDYTGKDKKTFGQFLAEIILESVPGDVLAKRLTERVAPGYAPCDYDGDDKPDTPGELKDRFLDDMADDNVDCSLKVAQDICRGFAVLMPVWLYDHSGISICVGERRYPYNDRWDSGFVGIAAVTRNDAMENLGGTDADGNTVALTDENWEEAATRCIKNEVETYDQYLTGNAYWYVLYEREDRPVDHEMRDDCWDEIDSCGSFYGADVMESGLAESVGHGLVEAITSGDYETGTAREKTIIQYFFAKDEKK